MKLVPNQFAYVVLTVGIIVSVISLYGVVSGLQRAAVQARAEFRDDIVWYSTQFRAELNALITALQGHAQAKDVVTSADIVDRFDVFWSRLESAGRGPLGHKFSQLANATETVGQALAVLREHESVVLALDRADEQEIQNLIGRLRTLHTSFHAVALAAVSAKTIDQEALYRQQSSGASRIIAFLVGILVLGGSLLMLLRIEKKKVDRLSEELKQHLIELEAAQHGLLKAERLAALGQVIATVSHELRNPLGTIYSSCEVLRRRLSETEPSFTRVLDRIERGINRCTAIIEELLNYTRSRELVLERIDVDSWVESVVREIEVPKEVAIVYGLGCGVSVWLDPERMRQVLVNLIDNAWHAMTEASDPRVPLLMQISVSSEVADERLLIHVSDTGPGIPQDKQETIFEPLYSTRTFGVGLGLPLVRQIMEQHGGDIELQPQSNSGATFTLSLPLDSRDAEGESK